MNNPSIEAEGLAARKLRERARKTVAGAVLSAFHYSCDLRDFEIARQLLYALEVKLWGQAGRSIEDTATLLAGLVAGHERLWSLRHTPI